MEGSANARAFRTTRAVYQGGSGEDSDMATLALSEGSSGFVPEQQRLPGGGGGGEGSTKAKGESKPHSPAHFAGAGFVVEPALRDRSSHARTDAVTRIGVQRAIQIQVYFY